MLFAGASHRTKELEMKRASDLFGLIVESENKHSSPLWLTKLLPRIFRRVLPFNGPLVGQMLNNSVSFRYTKSLIETIEPSVYAKLIRVMPVDPG